MAQKDVLVIGAGAAGLMAAHLLAKSGKKVVILEARDRIGGRINTISTDYGKTELGAEFIHGDLPITLDLLNEVGINYHAAAGEMWNYKNGSLSKEEENVAGWGEMMIKMQKLKEDTNLDSFLQYYFADEKYAILRTGVKRYVSGYDTADPADVSVFALRDEWQNEDEGAQHRLTNGYGDMMNYLADEIISAGGKIILNTRVAKIMWAVGNAKVTATDGRAFEADKLIIALPLGVLKLQGDEHAVIFEPPIPAQQQALQQIGFGAVVKVLLRFKTKFWEKVRDEDVAGALFFMSAEEIPTWWTQSPRHEALLTGWLGGNPAREFVDALDEELLEKSLHSLSVIFGIRAEHLKAELIEWHVANWTADPYTYGSYAYDRVGSADARKVLNEPIENTVYFAGEFLYHGPAMGTVEAALTSAQNAAFKVILDV